MMNTKSLVVLRNESFEISNPEVSIDVIADDVKILESPDGICRVEIFGKSEDLKETAELIKISADGNKLDVHIRRQNSGWKQFLKVWSNSLLVVIQLPTTSLLRIKTISGDVEVDQSVRRLDAHVISGDIKLLKNPTETCTMNSISGDMHVNTFSGCTYSLRSISGDIAVRVAPNLEIDVDGKSISGDMKSEISLNVVGDSNPNASGVVSITANTISGDFTLARY